MRKLIILSVFFIIGVSGTLYNACTLGDPSKCLDGGEGEECTEAISEGNQESFGEGAVNKEVNDETMSDSSATSQEIVTDASSAENPTTDRPKVECEKDEQCIGNQKRKLCDKNTNTCVECFRTDHCNTQTGKAHCKLDTNSCVECLVQNDCVATETCLNDICIAKHSPEPGREPSPEAGPEAGPEPGPEAGPEPSPAKPNTSPHTPLAAAPSFCQTNLNAACPAQTMADPCELQLVRFWFAFDNLKCRLEWYEELLTTPSIQNQPYCTKTGSKWVCRFETGCMNGVPKSSNGKWVNNFAIVLKDASNGAVNNAHDSSNPRLDLSGLCWNHPAIYKGVTNDNSSVYKETATPTKNFWNVCYGSQSNVSETSQTVIYVVDLAYLAGSMNCKF